MKPTTATPPQETLSCVCFWVGAEEYALDIMRIKEIINPLRITAVPRAPGFIEGVIELRGAILPVVDLRKRFDLPATATTRSTKYIIVAIDGRIVGLVVDRVGEVLRVAPGEIKAAPTFVAGENAAYFTGVCSRDGRIRMVLDIDRVLSSQEKISLVGMARPGTTP